MKTPFQSCSMPVRFLGISLSFAASLFGYGAAVMPAVMVPAVSVAATTTTVAVDQQPLTLQPTIPPNIVLMLDDSGSMKADFMPDFSYLQNNGNNNALINPANNGVYYDPTVTYTPPPKADSTATAPDAYPSQTDMTNVPQDGFGARNSGVMVNLYTYDGSYECNEFDSCGDGTLGSGKGRIAFNASVEQASAPAQTYDQTVHSTGGGNPIYADQVCQNLYNSHSTASNYAFTGANKDRGNWTSGECSFTYHAYVYFQYSTGAAAGPYTVYYVVPDASYCQYHPTPSGSDIYGGCVAASDTSGSAAPKFKANNVTALAAGENIANWFAYYHTRILMAKSGLMTAFSNLSPGFRVGFGSINGNNTNAIANLPNYAFSTDTNSSNLLAEVAPFGAPTDVSSQRINLWNWIASETGKGSTPLRQALDAVGKYYSATGSTTPAGHAWDTMSSDPNYVAGGSNDTQVACRQAYTILTTDGFWNASYSGVGNADGTAGTAVAGPNGQTYTYAPAAPYSDNYSDTLADVAMHYWETDLQSGLINEVPPSTQDPAFWQHMVTFTMGLGFTPMYADQTTPIPMDKVFDWANGGAAIPGFAWPQPAGSGGTGGSINNIADLAHAGVNGHGGFFSATNPQTFVSGIETALKRATERVGTGASLAANSTQLTTGTVIYQANYYTSTWKGDLKAMSVNPATGAIATTPTWQASQNMPAAASRTIQTWNGSGFVAFQNDSTTGVPPSLSTAQTSALGGGSSGSATAEAGMVNYLRGDQSQEQQNGGNLRTRESILGDIVNSQPVYSAAPDPNEFINQTFYGTTVNSTTNSVPFYDWAVGTTDSGGVFTASKASQRTPMIFVAANDGMLHAFNTQTGVEAFAYLPGAVITAGLANLSNPAYGSAADPHQYYNDGQLTIADAYIPSLPQVFGSSWHTILVGTTGRGPAESVYALDITDPTNIKPLWERSAGDGQSGSNYIGQMIGKPVIAQTNSVIGTGSTASSSTWSVLIGNGYNSAAGKAALLQFNLATGALSVHATDSSTANGLAAPVAWMNNPQDGVSDVAYAGDLLGRVWSFQLNDTTGGNPTPTSNGTSLFTAKDSTGKVQPITAGMLAGRDPHTGNIWLFFGTGQYLSSADLTNLSTQTWYGIIVQSSTSKLVSNLSSGRSALVQRTITAQTAGGSGALPARTVSAQPTSTSGTTDMTGKSGWYLDLLAPVGANNAPVQQGERMVDPNQFQGNLLLGVTRVPQVTDICNPSGSGWIMALDPFTGAAPSDDFFDTNGDGYINAGDRVNGNPAAGVGFGSLPNAPIFVGGIMETSFDNGTTSHLKTKGTTGTISRVTWRELVNP